MTYSVLGIDTQTGQRVEIPKTSRLQGLYIIGIPGTGKTGLIENLIIQDIKQDIGVCLLDPHGDLTQAVLSRLPDRRVKDVIFLDIADEDYPFGVNMFACDNPKSAKAVQIVVDQVMHIFEKLFDLSTSTTPRIRQYLRNCTQTLVFNPGYTMAEIPLLLLDEQCRNTLVAHVNNPQVQGFWKTYNAMRPTEQLDHSDSTHNKLDEFLQPLTVNIVGQSISTIDIRNMMDEGKILLVKLSAQLTSITTLIGSVIIALFLNAAYSRSDLDVKKRKQFNLYADEFQRFATEDFATLLTEARKFGIATTIAHQARYQPGMTDGIRATSLSAANLVVFKVNSKDATELAGQFQRTPPKPVVDWIEKEDGIEPLPAIVQNPFDHLVRNGHSDPILNNLVSAVLKLLANALEIAQIEEEQESPDLAKGTARREQVVIQTFNGREYVETRQRLLEGKHLINRLLFDLMQGNVTCGSEAMCDRLCAVATTLRALFGIAPGVTWYQEGSPRVALGEEYSRWGYRTAYSGGFTKGYWKEVAFDEQSAARLSQIVQALAREAQLSKDTLPQARLAFYTGKTEPEWEQEYLLVAPDKRIAEQQKLAYAALLAKKWEQFATLVTLDNCFRLTTHTGFYDINRVSEASLHELFNPHNNRWNTDIDWGTRVKRIQAGMTKSGLVCVRKADFPAIFYSNNCRHPRPLCEGYSFKKEITDTFMSQFHLRLGLCLVKLDTGSEEEVSDLVAGSWHEINKTVGHVNRKDATQAVSELMTSVKRIIQPLYDDAIFWFAPTCHFSHLYLGECTCGTDPAKCPYKGKCICQACQQLRATVPRLGCERTNKGKHGEDWSALGTWEYTAFPQAVAWVREFAGGLYEGMERLRRELKEAEEAQRQNGVRLEEATKRIAHYEQSQTFISIAEAEGERGVVFLSQFFQLCSMLARPDNHITGQSGQSQPRKHQHPIITQRSYPEMESLIANELVNLPTSRFEKFAKVKIVTDNEIEEHTIRTLKPEEGLHGKALLERIATIQEYNRTPDERGIIYCRSRQEVEEEIRLRQEQCSEPPEESPDAIYRRQPR